MYRIPDRLASLTLMFVLAVMFMGDRPEGIQGQGLTTLPSAQPTKQPGTTKLVTTVVTTPTTSLTTTTRSLVKRQIGNPTTAPPFIESKKKKGRPTRPPPPPANMTTTRPPPTNMTATPPPPANMTATPPPPANMTATPPPPANMTTPRAPPTNTTATPPPANMTATPPPPANMTTTPPPPINMTTPPPPSNMTTTLPPPTNMTTTTTPTTTTRKRRRRTTTKRPTTTTTTTTPTTTTAIPLICKYGSCKPNGSWPQLELMMMDFEAEFRILYRRGLVDDNGDALPSGPCDVAQAPRSNRSTRRQAELDYYTNKYLNLISNYSSDRARVNLLYSPRFKKFVTTIREEQRLFCRTQLGLSCITDPGSPGMEPYCGCTPPVYIPWDKPRHLPGTSLTNRSCSIQFSHPCDVCVPNKTKSHGYQLDFKVPCSKFQTRGTVFFYSGYKNGKDYCVDGSICAIETYGDLPTVKDPVKKGMYCIKNGTKSRVEQLIDPTSKQSKTTGSTVVLIYTLLLNLAYRSWCHSRNHLNRHTRSSVPDSTFYILHNFKHRRKFLPKNLNLQPDICQLK